MSVSPRSICRRVSTSSQWLKKVKTSQRLAHLSNLLTRFENSVAAETPNASETLNALALAHRSGPPLKYLSQWLTRGTPPGSHELQVLPPSTWQLANEFCC